MSKYNYAKLNKGFKTKWVKALQSGEFEQTNGKLKRKKVVEGETQVGYCCLGVATELVPGVDNRCTGLAKTDNGWPVAKVVQAMFPKKTYEGTRYAYAITKEDFTDKTDPNRVALTLHTLANMNDGGKSFKEIATFISKNL